MAIDSGRRQLPDGGDTGDAIPNSRLTSAPGGALMDRKMAAAAGFEMSCL